MALDELGGSHREAICPFQPPSNSPDRIERCNTLAMSEQEEVQWHSVRCIFQLQATDGGYLYGERLTLWQAASSEAAIALAEAETAEYVVPIDAKYIKLA